MCLQFASCVIGTECRATVNHNSICIGKLQRGGEERKEEEMGGKDRVTGGGG